MNIIHLSETDSTNTYVKQNASSLPSGCLVWAHTQTAGRGQRGNSWESTPGLNITASMLKTWNNFPANRQFSISGAVSLAILDLLKNDCNVDCKIKWPNDIYYNDLKICGILIEHSLSGKDIDRTIIGMGININQPRFLSDAPNPVSVLQITGREFDLQTLTERLAQMLHLRFEQLQKPGGISEINDEYFKKLWRAEGEYLFADQLTGRTFKGHISHIEPAGHITIVETEPRANIPHRYAFKEVSWIISSGNSAEKIS